MNYTVAAGAGTPTGSVTVSDGVDSCTGTVAAGTCSIALTTVGARTLTATYAGDANFSSSTSAGEPHAVSGVADLTVRKTNDVGGRGRLGSHWTWKLHVANGGTASATFAAGQPILLDDLPNAGLAYGTVSVSGRSVISGAGTLACAIGSNSLTCSAQGGPVSIGAATGAFDVRFTATPRSSGPYANPRAGGTCQVDPGNQITETSKANNHCSDTVSVPASRGDGGKPRPPRITVITPTNGGRYTQGQSVTAHYSCQDPPGAPGLASCTGTVPDGAPIDAARPGLHMFSVTATSRDGQKTTRKIHYIVLPSNHFVLGHVVTRFDGTVHLHMAIAGPGDVDPLATAPGNQATRARVLLQPARGRFAYARAHRRCKLAGTIEITLTPSKKGRRLLARDRAFTLILTLAYTPTRGETRKKTIHGLTVRP